MEIIQFYNVLLAWVRRQFSQILVLGISKLLHVSQKYIFSIYFFSDINIYWENCIEKTV